MADRKQTREPGIYRKVTVRMWGDAKVRALSKPAPCGQVLWVHLLTGEQTDIIPGLFKVGEAAFAEQLGWPLEGFREAFREVSALGMAEADWEARVVWVPNAIRHNPPVSPNVVKGWADAWDRIPECRLKLEAWNGLRAFIAGMSEAFSEAFSETCPKPSVMPTRNQEQEQKQEQNQKKLSLSRSGEREETESPGPGSSPVKSDAAGANTASGGQGPAARDGGEAASGGIPGEPGAAGPAHPAAGIPAANEPTTAKGGADAGREAQRAHTFQPVRPSTLATPATDGGLTPREQGARDRAEILAASTLLPHTGALLERLHVQGWPEASAPKPAAAKHVEAVVAAVGVELAAERLLALVRSDQALGVVTRPYLGWHTDAMQGLEHASRRRAAREFGRNPQVGVAPPSAPSDFVGGEREL